MKAYKVEHVIYERVFALLPCVPTAEYRSGSYYDIADYSYRDYVGRAWLRGLVCSGMKLRNTFDISDDISDDIAGKRGDTDAYKFTRG